MTTESYVYKTVYYDEKSTRVKKQAIIFKNKRVKNNVLFYKPYEMLP